MVAAPLFDCLALDLLPHVQNVLVASEVDVSRRQLVQTFVVGLVNVLVDDLVNTALWLCGIHLSE